jgi:hypothetical protein
MKNIVISSQEVFLTTYPVYTKYLFKGQEFIGMIQDFDEITWAH